MIFILPIAAVLLGFLIAIIFKPAINNAVKLLLAFSGAFLLSITIFEFLPLNRPIIQAECLKLRLRHIIFNKRFKKKLDLDRMQELDFVYKVESPSELYRCIVFSLDHPEEMSELRKDAHNYYLHKEDGKASLRLVEEIEKGLC